MTGSQANLDFSDASWGNGDPLTGQAQSLNLNFKPGMTLQAIAAQINAQAVTYDGSHNPIGTFSSKGGTITIINQPVTLGTVTLAGGLTLAQVADAINANSTLATAGVRAIVATDGTNEWLRVYDQQGKALAMAGSMVGTAAGEISFGVNQVANAAVVGDGSGARLQITHGTDSDMQVTGTMTGMLNIGPASTGTAGSLQVRSDIQANPSLISRGMVQYDPTSNQFFVAAADNSSVEAMANFMNSSITMPSAGGLGQGQYTLEQYGAAIISTNSTNASNNNTQLTYQQTLVNNLTSQKGAVSGVNLDEELSNLIVYQQSYAASAKVIATMQQLLDVLNSIVQ
jgi:flagellar hook-associated protein 1 FlgK